MEEEDKGGMMEALADFIKEVNRCGTEKRNGKKIRFNFVRRKRKVRRIG